MAMQFAPVARSTVAEVPDYLQAEIQRQAAEQAALNAEAQQEQQERAMLSQNLMGGAMLYNMGMGDKTPIADALRDWTGGGGAETATAAIPTAAPQMPTAGVNAGMPSTAAPQMPMAAETAGLSVPTAAPELPPAAEGMLPSTESLPAESGAMDMMQKAAPYLAALRGGQQALEGDIGGLASTGAKYYLSTLGPWGMGAALGASLLGL